MAYESHDFEERNFQTEILKFLLPLTRIRWLKGIIKAGGNPKYVWGVEPYAPKEMRPRIKMMVEVICKRNGKEVYHFERKRDLLVWRGQSILANLLSLGAVGTVTSTWKVVASENEDMPDMGDDSGHPEIFEFNPLIGTPVEVSYDFIPTIKPNGIYQTLAELIIEGTVTSDGNKTLRKIGIIDSNPTPMRNIIVEDAVIPRGVITDEEILIRYIVPLG